MSRRAADDDQVPRELLEDAERDAFEARRTRADVGTVGAEIALRRLAVDQRAAYSAFIRTVGRVSIEARKHEGGSKFGLEEIEQIALLAHDERPAGWGIGRRYLMTRAKADLHLLGAPKNPVVDWYIRWMLRSPIESERLLARGTIGAEARARFLEYVEEFNLRPALEGLWRQRDEKGATHSTT